jgi:hypothetical protein
MINRGEIEFLFILSINKKIKIRILSLQSWLVPHRYGARHYFFSDLLFRGNS